MSWADEVELNSTWTVREMYLANFNWGLCTFSGLENFWKLPKRHLQILEHNN